MRDLEKIKAKKVYSLDRGKVSIILAAAVSMGIAVFLLGLFFGLRKPAVAEAAPTDPLDALIAQNSAPTQSRGDQYHPSGVRLDYASKLSDEDKEQVVPPLVPASGEQADAPLPIEATPQELQLTQAATWGQLQTGPESFKIPADPNVVAFMEPPLSTMSQEGEKGIYTLHINSFTNRAEAGGYVAELRKSGHKAFLVATKTQERGIIYRVRIGPFFSRHEAEKYRKKFEEAQGVPTYVVKRVLPH